jgi:hypothetical protein
VDKRWAPAGLEEVRTATGDLLGYFANQNDAEAREKSIQLLNEPVTTSRIGSDRSAYLLKLTAKRSFDSKAPSAVIRWTRKCYANPSLPVWSGSQGTRALTLRTNNLAQVHETFTVCASRLQTSAFSVVASRGSRTPELPTACETIDLTKVKHANRGLD